MANSTRKYSFLIADDCEDIRTILAIVVRLLNGEVAGSAEDGEECLKLYKKVHPDIVLLDIMMPGISGFEVIKELIRYDREAKVIMVSCQGNEDYVVESMRLGAKYFIAKPFKPVEAAQMIREQIEKWWPEYR